jgi:hypothetical protein
MRITPHPQKKNLNIVVLEGEEIVPVRELVMFARRNNVVDDPTRGNDALIWISYEGSISESLPVAFRIDYLCGYDPLGGFFTRKHGLQIPEVIS